MRADEVDDLKKKVEEEVNNFNEAKAKFDADLQARLGRISILRELVAEAESKAKRPAQKKTTRKKK